MLCPRLFCCRQAPFGRCIWSAQWNDDADLSLCYHLLMAALHAAVALVQVHHVAMRVCQYLNLRIVCQYCGQECYSLACIDASPNIIRQGVQGKATSTCRGSSTNRSANMEPSLQTPARGSVVKHIILQHILTDR